MRSGIIAMIISEFGKKNDLAATDQLARRLLGIDGGPGSGNFGHNGRPGKVGGSAKEDGVSGEVKEAAAKSQNFADFWYNLPESEQKKLKTSAEIKELFEKARKEAGNRESEWKPANGKPSDMPKRITLPSNEPEIVVYNDPGDTATAHAGEKDKIRINLANLDESNVDSIIAHEAAHQLSNNDPELQRAIILNYGNVLGRYNHRVGHFDGIYGEYSPEEAFATGFSNYRNHPEHMKRNYPEAYGFFDRLCKEQPEAMGYIDNCVKSAQRVLKERKGGSAPASYSRYKEIFGSWVRDAKNALEKQGADMPENPTDEDFRAGEKKVLESGDPEALYGTYFSNKTVETGWFDQVDSNKFENLTDEEAEFVMEKLADKDGRDSEEKEYGFLYSDASKEDKLAYLNIMSKATDGGYSQEAINRVVSNSENRRPSGFAKVIDDVRASHEEGKPYTRDELRKAGKAFADEHKKAVDEFEDTERFKAAKVEWDKAVDERREAKKAAEDEKEKINSLIPGSREYKDQLRAIKEADQRAKEAALKCEKGRKNMARMRANKARICMTELLKKVRRVGMNEVRLFGSISAYSGMGNASKVFGDAINSLPEDWLENSVKQGSVDISPLAGDRANHVGTKKHSTISISQRTSAESTDDVETCIHEFVHRLEQTEPELHKIEKEFYEERTKGQQEEPLYKLCPGRGYGRDEYAIKDSFPDPYCGKSYNDDTYEILTCGISWAYTCPSKFVKDDEYRELVYGVLAMI